MDASVEQTIEMAIRNIADDMGLYLYDLELSHSLLKVTLASKIGNSTSLDDIANSHSHIYKYLESESLISLDRVAIEVSTPGLERKLRTVEHFKGAIGENVTIKLKPDAEGLRRMDGVLESVNENNSEVVLSIVSSENGIYKVSLTAIEKAKVVFKWDGGGKESEQLDTSDSIEEDFSLGSLDSLDSLGSLGGYQR